MKNKLFPVITVRKGSSLKDKNIRPYKGKPLLVNCIEKCLEVFGEVCVISDSKEYAEIAINAGANVVIDEEVASDEDVTVRLRKFAERNNIEGRIILCQCTSPNILLNSYKKVKEQSMALADDEIIISCTKVTQKPSAFYLKNEDGYLTTAIKNMPVVSVPRQQLESVYYYNGGITSFHTSQLKNDSLFENAKLMPMILTEAEVLDIDSEKDFSL
jgi:CMP-N-acetylneuraminic acid synthetase